MGGYLVAQPERVAAAMALKSKIRMIFSKILINRFTVYACDITVIFLDSKSSVGRVGVLKQYFSMGLGWGMLWLARVGQLFWDGAGLQPDT